MPLVKWACPSDKPTYGEVHAPEHCILSCKDKCLSPFLIAALTRSERTNHHRGKYLSVTSLKGCTRQLKSRRTVNYAAPMKNSLYAYRGTVKHQVVEDAAAATLLNVKGKENVSLLDLGFITEWRMLIGFCFKHGGFEVPESVSAYDESTWDAITCPQQKRKQCECFLLGGTLDGIEPLWHAFDKETGELEVVIWDTKTMADYALRLFIEGDKKTKYHPTVKDDYVEQVNVYKYMVQFSKLPENLAKFGVKKIIPQVANIQAISMNEFPRSGTKYLFEKSRAKNAPPDKQFLIPEIEFWEDKKIVSHITKEARARYTALILDEGRGDICDPESNAAGSHSWLCNYCPFHLTAECPDPKKEWKLIKDGMDPEEAFSQVLHEWESK